MLNKCSGSLTLLAVRRFCGPCRRLHYHKDNPNNINIAKNLLNNNIQARCSTNEASWKLAQKELDLKIREYEQKLKDVKLNDINKKSPLNIPDEVWTKFISEVNSYDKEKENHLSTGNHELRRTTPLKIGPLLLTRIGLLKSKNTASNNYSVDHIVSNLANDNTLLNRQVSTEEWNSHLRHLLNIPKCFLGVDIVEIVNFFNYLPQTVISKSSLEIWKAVEESGMKVMPDLLVLLMESTNASGDFRKTVQLYHLYQKSNAPPNGLVYQSYAIALSSLGKHKDLVALYSEQKSVSITPSKDFLNACIKAFSRTKEFTKAWEVFNFMKFTATSISPSAETYGLMIQICSSQYNPEKALDLYNEMKLRPIDPLTPTTFVINNLIHALATDVRFQTVAFSLLQDLSHYGLRPNHSTLYELIRLIAYSGKLDYMKDILDNFWVRQKLLPSILKVEQIFHFIFRALISAEVQTSSVTPDYTHFKEEVRKIIDSSKEPLIPFLKRSTLTENDLFLNAIYTFEYAKRKFPEALNSRLVTDFLNIFLERGSVQLFKEIYQLEFREMSTMEGSSMKVAKITLTYIYAIKLALLFNDFEFGYAAWQEYWHCKIHKLLPKEDASYEQKVVLLTLSLLSKNKHTSLARSLLLSHLDKGWTWNKHSLGFMRKMCSVMNDQATVYLIDSITNEIGINQRFTRK
ncbi:mitochondrial PPR repeat protein Ppr3 [Schizosaccharomyces pombe]|uniref:Mitochondrial 15S rRNA processing factor ppr3 n=1 Tax=Schizosaccharomyces pombe (strain 972 / ATCC 24843) TaxID=284812 RepID=CCM1_SCHPO|nr:PPR repeat-containing protein Ppr3 [Schizosaccharomyces pombe]O42955.1 RecName: Full=Pentatricopeptide repeat-containing protein 3, mitochondrial; AltName: Full=Mitochondrial group I intron splicing factor dmr1; Flags: Precursor [Schizosaccharomyces pombe 972h-]CAA17061.1 mitochondrial PPR repeat protein Ppr3 [Schizosaccharomyces pombe]|eukprot:NP_595973.1 PPR repeat-containing protein Ppr3 [Schizosaccharomyces pombe]